MTREQLDKMTPEEKRIRIAEACGWTCVRFEMMGTYCGEERVCRGRMPQPDGFCTMQIPDYLSDLNAMHEAEKTLTCVQIGKYEWWIEELAADGRHCVPHASHPTGGILKIAHATAAQRADAFLLTLDDAGEVTP